MDLTSTIQFCIVRQPVGRCRLPPSGATTGPQREATAASLSHPSWVPQGAQGTFNATILRLSTMLRSEQTMLVRSCYLATKPSQSILISII